MSAEWLTAKTVNPSRAWEPTFAMLITMGAPIFVVGQVGDTFPLFLNRGKDFEDVTGSWGLSGLTAGLTGWGAGIADFDNDGWKDLFVACSAILDNSEEINHLPSKLPDKVFVTPGTIVSKMWVPRPALMFLFRMLTVAWPSAISTTTAVWTQL